ncbi:hypothetical protein AB6C46_23575, partial [Vibrio sp. 10N.237.312.C02]
RIANPWTSVRLREAPPSFRKTSPSGWFFRFWHFASCFFVLTSSFLPLIFAKPNAVLVES